MSRAACCIGLASLLVPAALAAQSIGVYFDSLGTRCVSTIEPFGPCQPVYIVADAPVAEPIAGALLTLEFPPDIRVCGNDPEGIEYPGRNPPTARGSLASGLDLQYFPCVAPGRVLLAKFHIFDAGFVPRQELRLHLTGTGPDSVSNYLNPQLKICDPGDPEGNLGLIETRALDAVLNCPEPCVCTTAVVQRTWTHLKTLFRGR